MYVLIVKIMSVPLFYEGSDTEEKKHIVFITQFKKLFKILCKMLS